MAIRIGRRRMLAAMGSAAACAAAPFAARSQEPAVVRIGVLNSISYGPILDRLDAFLDQLENAGFVDGQNLMVEYLSAEGRAERLPFLAAELVQQGVQAIVCLTGASTVRAAMEATFIIPIVFCHHGRPIRAWPASPVPPGRKAM